jgi:trk system potassium uptake protein TrkA
MGTRVAQSLSYPMVSRYMGIEDNHFIVKIEIKANQKGERFNHLMDHGSGIKTILHKRGKDILYSIDPNLILQEGDILVVEGELEPLRKLSARFK